MNDLTGVAGFMAVVITLLNGTALNEDLWLKHYSVAFNVFDIFVAVWVCLKSPSGRNFIIRRAIQVRTER